MIDRENKRETRSRRCVFSLFINPRNFLYGSSIIKVLSLKNHIMYTLAARAHFKLPEVTFRILKGYNSTGLSQHSRSSLF